MGYYDNVKDNVREKSRNGGSGSGKNSSSGNSGGSGNFETLKQAASEEGEEEEKGDDTPIEVLEEDGLSRERPNSKEKSSDSLSTDGNPLKKNQSQDSSSTEESTTGDFSGLERKMDKIIEQNDEMIRILRSFAE